MVQHPKFTHSLAFRLTVWYGCLLAAAAVLCFAVAYVLFRAMSERRADTYLVDEAAECRRLYQGQGFEAVIQEIAHEARSTGTNDMFMRLVRPDGTTLASSDLSQWSDASIATRGLPVLSHEKDQRETWTGLSRHRAARVFYARLGSDMVLQIGVSMAADEHLLRQMEKIAAVVIIGVVLMAILVGWLMAKRALAGVQEVTNTAMRISEGVLDQRVPTSGWNDEVDLLAKTFNRMIERIGALVAGMRQTNDNIAHELRSPVTRIRGMAELALARPEPEGEQSVAANTIEECDRLLALINTMLDIAEVEAGIASLRKDPVNIGEIVRDACEIFEPVAEQAGVSLNASWSGAGPEEAWVRGDVSKMQRAVANLVDNAIKYTPRGGSVGVEVASQADTVRLTITDTGPGIPEEDLPHIFKRFYRSEKSRTQKGYGLGLSLAQAIVRAHGGVIEVRNRPSGGCVFEVRLPRATAPGVSGVREGLLTQSRGAVERPS